MDYKDLIIPTINVNDEKVTIWDIRFKNLEFIHEGEILYSVETSKAAEEYEADSSGYVVLYVEEGDEVAVGKSAGMIFKNKCRQRNNRKLHKSMRQKRPLPMQKQLVSISCSSRNMVLSKYRISRTIYQNEYKYN